MPDCIVVAEDEDGIRNNLLRLLRIEGFEVYAGRNGREALELVRKHRPQLVLSDVMMPEMSGHELVAAMRADAELAATPAVLLTARADRTDVREGMNVGADDYLTKPFQRDELLACIRSRLDKSRQQQAALQQLAAQAHRLTHYDSLTGLPNRAHFQLLLGQALRSLPVGQAQGIALWIVGIDNLAQQAQVLDAGDWDAWVRRLGARLGDGFVEWVQGPAGTVTLARMGDDRFVAMVTGWPLSRPMLEVARPMLELLQAPVMVAAEPIHAGISIGHVLVEDSSLGTNAIFGRLELALASARTQAGERVAAFSSDLAAELSETWRLHGDLHRAVEAGQIEAFFQPQIHLPSGRLEGFEALMRWRHPALGLVSPGRFIPLAEDNGQIVAMGRWILERACQVAARWPQPYRIAVNLSARQFADSSLPDVVQAALRASGLPAHRLELEITESTVMQDLQRTLDLLRTLKGMGVELAIDDFGTGYSSLAYLKRFPLDVLKIDQSFVRHLCTDADDRAIAQAVVQLARSLRLRVVAEGVETHEQEEVLRGMACETVQGYLHGKPMAESDLAAWLQRPDPPAATSS